MDILLIDVDSLIDYHALMQISSYYKSKGHNVGFNIGDPDRVYIGCIFRENRGLALGRAKLYPNAEVYLGGSGINYDWLPSDMQKIRPDYDLYPSYYSMGFTTRGCIRKCPFCIVPQKEGKHQRWMHIKDFHDDRFSVVRLLDSNWFVDKDWFFENTDYILENDLRIIEEGMDIRLLDKDIAQRLKEIRFEKGMHFAFDSMSDEPHIRKGIKILKSVGINIRNEVQFYVLVNFNTTQEQDKYRCRLLKKLGTNPFVMAYNNIKTEWTQRIGRWANRKEILWSCDIDEYNNKNLDLTLEEKGVLP